MTRDGDSPGNIRLAKQIEPLKKKDRVRKETPVRTGAMLVETKSSHVAMLSKPEVVTEVILKAAKSVPT